MVSKDDLKLLLDRGAYLYAAGQSAAAANLYRQALKIAPDDPTVQLRHALAIWHGENKAEEALATISSLARQYPQAPVHAAEALVLGSMGRFEDAADSARRAVTADPGHASAWIDLATSTAPANSGALADEIATVLKKGWTHDQRRQLHYARAAALRKAGQADAAFVETAKANALVQRRWDAEREQAFIDKLREVFDRDLLQQLAGKGHPDPSMIFITGMPRSGTTLLERLLVGHPDIETAGETPIIGNLFSQFEKQVGNTSTALRRNLTPDHLNAIGTATLKGMIGRLNGRQPTRIIDKMPANHLFLPFISLIFPKACILSMRRHPLDTCLSCWEASFSFGLDYASDMPTLGKAYRQYSDLNDHWMELLGSRVRPVSYEAMVHAPEATLRPVLEHMGMGWDDRCLVPADTGPIKTSSVAQARRPVNTRSIGRWKAHAQRLRPLVEALGGMDRITRIAAQTGQLTD